MKLVIKTLKQLIHNIEVPSEKTNSTWLKKEIEKTHEFESDQLKLFHNDVILVNEKTLEDYKKQEERVIFMMNKELNQKMYKHLEQVDHLNLRQKKKPEEKKPEEKRPEEPKPHEKKKFWKIRGGHYYK